MLLSVNEYAQHCGCSSTAVEYAINRGFIKRNVAGQIDQEQADAEWLAKVDPAKVRRRDPAVDVKAGESRKGAWTEKRAESVAASKFAEAQTIANNINFAESRATKESWAAKLKELEYEQRKSSLISRSEVEIAAETAGRRLRDALMNLPPRLSAQLAAELDPFEIHRILETELRQVLDEAFGGGRVV